MKLKLKKGLKLNISGALCSDSAVTSVTPATVAVTPDDFPGLVPKAAVKEGDIVEPGSPLLYDKKHNDVKVVSPVHGKVRAIVRGDRRKIMRIEVDVESGNAAQNAVATPANAEEAHNLLAHWGLLAMMRQRPYDIIPTPGNVVRDIFVTAFDPAPLAASMAVFSSLFSKEDYIAGVAFLKKATVGKVYFCYGDDWTLGAIDGAENVVVEGNFPAGNAGVIAANIAPVNKGEIIWTLDACTLARIGRTARTGMPEWRTIVAVTGPEISQPAAIETVIGAQIEPLIKGRTIQSDHHRRIISGNVLTGNAVDANGYLRYPYRQITVIAEGDDRDEFMGWASFSPSKMSENRSFPGHFFKKAFAPDARLFGGRRAMIMSGEYDRYMPMDILPEYLLKAIIARNIEEMENLGIYEVAPEDFAAAEYADTSKIPLQSIVREGLDYLRKELE